MESIQSKVKVYLSLRYGMVFLRVQLRLARVFIRFWLRHPVHHYWCRVWNDVYLLQRSVVAGVSDDHDDSDSGRELELCVSCSSCSCTASY